MSDISTPIRLSPLAKWIAVLAVVGLTVALLRSVGEVLSPFVAGAITAYLFYPLISWLHRRTGVARAVWILVLYVLAGLLIYGLVRFLGPLLVGQYQELLSSSPRMIRQIADQLAQHQTINLGGLALDIGPIEEPLINLLGEFGRGLPATVPHLFASAVESILLFFTYLVVTFYFLNQADQIVEWAYGLVPAPYRAEIRGLGHQIDRILMGYIRGTLLLIPIMSFLTLVALSILGVQYALVIAILSGFLEIIPLIGPWSAAGIAITVSLLQSTTPFGWHHGVLALVIGLTYFVLRMFEDNFIIPHVVGHAVKLHPVVVIFAVLAGGALGGAFGLLVSIPTMAIAILLLRYLYRKLIDSPEPLPPDMVEPTRRRRQARQAEPAPRLAEQTPPPAAPIASSDDVS
jgi:predicted PurR-regulated permease PerM